jgi:hypothetical protein
MKFVRIDTNDGETRWLNLETVSRVTRACDAHGEIVLVIMFADSSSGGTTLRIPGNTPVDQAAIDRFLTELDALVVEEEPTLTPSGA